ncbi:hypothetical protein ACFL2W_01195, partial [Candidatus Omnitrophota bacterium]
MSFKNLFLRYAKAHPLRFFFIVLAIACVAIGVYLLLWEAFDFLNSLGGLGTVILRRLFYILFSILFFMVAISFSILFYSCGFKSRDTEFLLSMPLAVKRVFFEKFTEASILACWIPFLGVILFMSVYCKVSGLSPLFVFAFLFYLLPFLCIITSGATILLLIILRFLNLKKLMTGMVFLSVLGLIYYYRSYPRDARQEAVGVLLL